MAKIRPVSIFVPDLPLPDAQGFHVKRATIDDADDILRLLKGQAHHHGNSSNDVKATADDLRRTMLTPGQSYAEAVLLYKGQQAAGVMVFYPGLTSLGRSLYLEDIYIDPNYRHGLAGQKLMGYLAEQSQARSFTNLAWVVSDDNEGGKKFYHRLGSVDVHARIYRIDPAASLPPCQHSIDVKATVMKQVDPVAAHYHPSPQALALVARDKDKKVVAAGIAYRNFSTFRAVPGIHLDYVAVAHGVDRASILQDFVGQTVELARKYQWNGQIDVTVADNDQQFQQILSNFPYQVLTMTDDPASVMKPFVLPAKPMQNLADNFVKRLLREQQLIQHKKKQGR